MRKGPRRLLAFLTLAVALPLAAGCDSLVGDDGHSNAAGLEIRNDAGDVLVSVRSQEVSGELIITEGTTLSLDLFFLDFDGKPFRIQQGAGGLSFDWIHGNATIADVVEAGDRHELRGHRTGTSTVNIRVLHEFHTDYTSPSIPIRVEAADDT